MGKTRSRGNGEGTIFKRTIRGKDKWVCEYTIGIKKDGTRDCITKYSDTRKEAKDKLEEIITQYKTNTLVKKSSVIFKDITKEFIDMGLEYNKLSISSYARKLGTYKSICGHYIADMEIQKITEQDVKSFLVYITKYSNSVIGKIYGIVNNTFKIAVRRKIIKDNFLDNKMEFCKPTSSRRDKKVRGFTVEEQKRFIKVVTAEDNQFKYKYQLLLSMYTGMRMRRG